LMLLDVMICDHDQDQRTATCQTRVTLGICMMLLDVVIFDHDQDQQAARDERRLELATCVRLLDVLGLGLRQANRANNWKYSTLPTLLTGMRSLQPSSAGLVSRLLGFADLVLGASTGWGGTWGSVAQLGRLGQHCNGETGRGEYERKFGGGGYPWSCTPHQGRSLSGPRGTR
jgi:hypothetical protein